MPELVALIFRPVPSTLFTPFTCLARCSTWVFCFDDVTVPVSVTTPSVVLTEISEDFTPLAAASFDFTFVVIHESSTLPGAVSLLDDEGVALEDCVEDELGAFCDIA